MINLDHIQLKAVKEKDEPFVKDLTHQEIGPYIRSTWNTKEEQDKCFQRIDHREGKRDIIYYKNRPIGFLSIQDNQKKIFLDQIYITSEYQGLGIGTYLVKTILKDAVIRNKPVKLIVLKANPAKVFYDSLGFSLYDEDQYRYYMHWKG